MTYKRSLVFARLQEVVRPRTSRVTGREVGDAVDTTDWLLDKCIMLRIDIKTRITTSKLRMI